MTEIKRKVIVNNQAFFDYIAPFLEEGRQVSFLVKGESMRPFLFEGDKVWIRKPLGRTWRSGDLILARWCGNYVLHRLVKRKKDLLGLAGDANLVQIEWINEADIIAVALSARREDQKIYDADSSWQRVLGMCWYYLRPFRRVLAKIKKIEKV